MNLAAAPAKNKKLITAMNAIIKEEVGLDYGSSLGLKQDTEYAFSKVDI